MEIPPKPKTPYILDKEQDKRILEKLNKLAEKGFKDEKLLSLLYSQLETDWRSPLEEFIDKLCKLIKMKKYGEALIPYFGLDKPFTKGYSLVQLIETSSITGHFSENWRISYINIFSCKKYNHKLAEKFTKDFFKAKRVKSRLLIR